MCEQQRLRSACAYAQSDQRLCLSLEYSLTLRLLTEYHLEFLILRGGCLGLSESTLVKMTHCWKSHVTAKFCNKITKDIYCLSGMGKDDVLDLSCILIKQTSEYDQEMPYSHSRGSTGENTDSNNKQLSKMIGKLERTKTGTENNEQKAPNIMKEKRQTMG